MRRCDDVTIRKFGFLCNQFENEKRFGEDITFYFFANNSIPPKTGYPHNVSLKLLVINRVTFI